MQVGPTSVLGLQASLQKTWDATASSLQALVPAVLSTALETFSSSQQPALLLVCVLRLGWSSNCVGSQAFWGELPVQPGSECVPLRQPSEDCPSRALAFWVAPYQLKLLAGESLIQVVVSVAGGCMRVVPSKDRAARQVLRREIRNFSRGGYQNWGHDKARARSPHGPAD